MPSLQSTAALARLDGLATAFVERPDISSFISQFPGPLAIRLAEFTALVYQSAYIVGHREGMNHADRTIANHVQELLEGKPDAD